LNFECALFSLPLFNSLDAACDDHEKVVSAEIAFSMVAWVQLMGLRMRAKSGSAAAALKLLIL
jgi:hypothetical protein